MSQCMSGLCHVQPLIENWARAALLAPIEWHEIYEMDLNPHILKCTKICSWTKQRPQLFRNVCYSRLHKLLGLLGARGPPGWGTRPGLRPSQSPSRAATVIAAAAGIDGPTAHRASAACERVRAHRRARGQRRAQQWRRPAYCLRPGVGHYSTRRGRAKRTAPRPVHSI